MKTTNEEKMQEILKQRGIAMHEVENFDKKDIPAAHDSFNKIMETYWDVKISIDMEDPYWYNRVWWENDGDVLIVRRAKAMAAALSHGTPTIYPNEKLVMQKTKNFRGAFPYPWVTASFFNKVAENLMAEVDAPAECEADMVSQVGAGGGNVGKSYGNVISIAKKFGCRKEDIPILVKISKYWEGISVEELSYKYSKMMPDYDLFQKVMDSVICMLDSYTIPQGREIINYYLPLEYGFDGLIKMCDEKIAETMGEAGTDGVYGMDHGFYYVAMKEICKGMSKWCENYADRAAYLATVETDPKQKAEYLEIVKVMNNIAHKRPASFREALQLTLCCHFGVVNEDPMSGMSIGRIGQVLQPYLEKDLREGVINEDEVLELLELYRIKITALEIFASAGVTGGVLSGNTFNNLSIGGLNKEGLSAVTPLEYLIVEAGMRAKTPEPTLSLLYDEKLPEDFVMKCALCSKLGFGYPAWMSNQGGMNFMLRNYADEGMDLVKARAWCLGGCLESSPGAFQPLHYDGKETWIPGGAGPTASTGIHFLALPKVLELVLTNGYDHRMKRQILPVHNKVLKTYDDVMDQFKAYMRAIGVVVNKANNIQMDIWRKYNMPVVHSLLKAGCFENGLDIGKGGCLYTATINYETTGQVNLINSLASLKKNVFEDKKYTLEEMTDAMLNNFGYKTAWETQVFSLDTKVATDQTAKYAKIYADCVNAPKYGNDDDYADSIYVDFQDYFPKMVHELTSYYGKPLYLCQISVSTHGPQGMVTMATSDGRLAGLTFADATVSAAAGTDKEGIYALMNSATKWDHSINQNSQLNLKLSPNSVKGYQGTKNLLELIRSYMRRGGFHVQFNVVDSDTLREAQKSPTEYRDLMVRVAGFTQYWCEIGKSIQDEVIYRTEYENC